MHACVRVRATETATARGVFKSSSNANLKGFIHGDGVVRLCAGRRLFGASAPGIEMAGTAAVRVFE
jgi:hypothetical protein